MSDRARHRPSRIVLAACAVVLPLAPTPAPAGHVPQPAPIEAFRAFCGDPLWGLGPGEPGELFTKNADSPAGMASTAKTWAMHLLTHAVLDGVVELDDVVTMSSNALIPRCHGAAPSPARACPRPATGTCSRTCCWAP